MPPSAVRAVLAARVVKFFVFSLIPRRLHRRGISTIIRAYRQHCRARAERPRRAAPKNQVDGKGVPVPWKKRYIKKAMPSVRAPLRPRRGQPKHRLPGRQPPAPLHRQHRRGARFPQPKPLFARPGPPFTQRRNGGAKAAFCRFCCVFC